MQVSTKKKPTQTQTFEAYKVLTDAHSNQSNMHKASWNKTRRPTEH